MADDDKKTSILVKVFGGVIAFLTWFILVVSFFGDITIWCLKFFFKALGKFGKKTGLGIISTTFKFLGGVGRFFRHPIFSQDKSFKVGLITIAALVFTMWYSTHDLPSPKQLETRQVVPPTKK